MKRFILRAYDLGDVPNNMEDTIQGHYDYFADAWEAFEALDSFHNFDVKSIFDQELIKTAVQSIDGDVQELVRY